ncbi:MAG TPA: SusC/RagA family TonB-linked outer membrane protein, partial [Cyclobacteriaceae bacterium]|nr:SusC/RagA family TonB-linked outer membrane protein [Cyclobacteriaceae bacterium]
MKKILLMNIMFLMLVAVTWAQDRIVLGKVTSAEDGATLPGVSVVVKGTTIGGITDAEGKYSLSISPSDIEGAVLVFTFIGMKTQEIQLKDRPENVIDVVMTADASQLAEVVVTGLGFERSAKSLGYATTKVNSEDITRGRSTNVMASLQGKVAGVQISTASGAPGASTKVVIRGYTSLSGGNNPLYVVDGVPINNSAGNFFDPSNTVNRTQDFGNRANDINPDDIAEITVLKGASAASLYGSRAASGVIMITTKRGKAGSGVNVDFTSSSTFSTPLRLPDRQTVFGQGWNGHFAFEENGSWGPKLDGKDRLWGNVVDDSQQIKPFKAQKNNLKDFYDVGKSFINTLAISGGTDKATYYLSYSNVQEDGIVPADNDSYKRNTLSFRGSTTGKKLFTSYSVNYVNKKSKYITTGQGGAGATMYQEIIQIPVDMSIVDFKDYHNKFNNLDNYFTLYATNPYFVLHENGNDYEENRVFGNAQVDYEFTDWIKATTRVGGDIANSQLLDWIAIARTDPNSPNAGQTQVAGRVEEVRKFARELYGDFIVSANRNLTDRLSLQALAGYSIQERYFKDFNASVSGLTIPKFYNLSNSDADPVAYTNESKTRLLGLYGQATLGYNEYLFLTLQARNDWSSTLPQNHNSFFYPSANISFSFVDAFKLTGPFSSGKLRAAIGRTGKDAPVYSVYTTLANGGISLPFGDINFPLGGVNAFEISNTLGNKNLKPELSTEVEIGANVQFFHDRLGFDVAVYDKRTVNQIYPVPFPTSTGYGFKTLNFGEIQNRGIELLVTAVPVSTKNFTWTTSFNFTKNNNKVLALADGLDRVTLG